MNRKINPAIADGALLLAAWWFAFWLRFNFDIPDEFLAIAWMSTPWAVLANLAGLLAAGVYRQVWRYIGLPELRQLGMGVALGGAIAAAAVLMQRYPNFPRSVLVLQPLVALLLLGGVRASWRMLRERRESVAPQARRLLIVGSLQDAADALRALKGSRQWVPVGILSPIATEKGRLLQNVPVLGTAAMISSAAQSTGANTALIASPAGSRERTELLLNASDAGVTLLTMPRPDEWLKTETTGPRKIELEDLLGRTPVQLDVAGLSDLFSGQTVMVTGAGKVNCCKTYCCSAANC